MPQPHSSDLRERAVAQVLARRNCRQTALQFGVGASRVIRWVAAYRERGSSAARPMGGRRRLILLPERDWLLARLAVAPDLTVRGLRAELLGRGVRVSYGAIWSFLASERLTFKQTLHAAEQDRPDVAAKRAR